MPVAVWRHANKVLKGEEEGDTFSRLQIFLCRKAVYITKKGDDGLKIWLNKMKKLLQKHL